MSTPFILCDNLVKIFKVADIEVVALQGLDLTVESGEMLGIVGTSGSGKSTLLNVLGGLDRPSAGTVSVDGLDLLKATNRQLDRYRREQVGFVWQQTTRNLVPWLTAQQNVELPMTLIGLSGRKKRKWVQELLEAVGLWEYRRSRLAQLSGGQQQRIAIATALANKPRLLLGDEPTGELDTQTAAEVMQLLRQVNEQFAITVLVVTHDPDTAAALDRVVTLRDGRTSSETVRRQAAVASDAALNQTFEEFLVVDSAGRLQLPEALRDEAGIGRRVTLDQTKDGLLIRPINSAEAKQPQTEIIDDDPPPAQPNGWRRWFTKRQ